MCTDWDYVNVRDFEYLNNLWNKELLCIKDNDLEKEIKQIGKYIIGELKIPIGVDPLSKDQSVFFKTVYLNPARISNKIIDVET